MLNESAKMFGSATKKRNGERRRPPHLDMRTVAWITAWSVALVALLSATNSGFTQRIQLLLGQERLITLVSFLGVWGLTLLCLLLIAWQHSVMVRVAWSAVIAAATAVGVGYRNASGSDLTVFDAVSLWSVRHEAARAAYFYGDEALWPMALLVATVLVIMTAPRPTNTAARRWIGRLALAPVVPIAAIAAIIFIKEGGGAQALPVQFTPLSVGFVSAATLAANSTPEREPVRLQPGPARARSIVILVDESIRGDVIDFTPGNDTTPLLAENRGRIVDFGIAASGGTCSHYSNAILRFTAQPSDLGGRILRNATIWQYAHKAGFETVYIDGQSSFNKNPSKLQNFMTVKETSDIDRFYTFEEDTPAYQLDYKILDVVLKELSSGAPKLIYANKNGAHFPYDDGYPSTERLFRPVMSETAVPTAASMLNSYKNAVRWSVDRFFTDLLAAADLKDAVIIYTSDHGQNFDPGSLTHCSVDDPASWEGLVPLFTVTDNPELKLQFEKASLDRSRRSHFEIMPTALALMGFSETKVRREKGNTLFQRGSGMPAFSSGDIFGLFSKNVRWHEVHPDQVDRESERTGTGGRPDAAWSVRLSRPPERVGAYVAERDVPQMGGAKPLTLQPDTLAAEPRGEAGRD